MTEYPYRTRIRAAGSGYCLEAVLFHSDEPDPAPIAAAAAADVFFRSCPGAQLTELSVNIETGRFDSDAEEEQ